jgi:acylglycerol lipase
VRCHRLLPPPAVFEKFAAAGIAVYAYDAVGHGKSEGHRALVEDYKQTVDDFLAHAAYAEEDLKQRYPGAALAVPAFIAGHSLGGLMAALACQRDQGRWAGLLLCSPSLDVEWNPVLK